MAEHGQRFMRKSQMLFRTTEAGSSVGKWSLAYVKRHIAQRRRIY